MEDPESMIAFQDACISFSEVNNGLNPPAGSKGYSVPFALAARAIKGCLVHLDTPEARHFLSTIVFKLLCMALSPKSPIALNQTERRHTEDMILDALKIFLRLAGEPEEQAKHLGILDLIFSHDPAITFYNYTVRKQHYSTGDYSFPTVRTRMAKYFANGKGFEMILHNLLPLESSQNFLSHDVTLNIFRCLENVADDVAEDTRSALVDATMTRLLAETEEQLKREGTDSLGRLINSLQNLSAKVGSTLKFLSFWREYTIKLVNSKVLSLKLCAWDQASDIIRDAIARRPPAHAYIVKNAGLSFVNGEYRQTRPPTTTTNSSDFGKGGFYTKEPSSADEHTVTLFRCTMRSGPKWWFLSKADPISPGSEKDVDYYVHKCIADQSSHSSPPATGWEVHHGHSASSGVPAPTLTRVDLPPREEDEPSTVTVVSQWLIEQNFLDHAFGPSSIKAETVTRAWRVASFLVECNALTESHVSLIWKAAMQNQDTVITESVFTVLSSICAPISERLFCFIIDLALESLAASASSQESSSNAAKITIFLDHISRHGSQFLSDISEASNEKLLDLVWTVRKSPQFETLKTGFTVDNLLVRCLSRNVSGRATLQKVSECLTTLRRGSSSSPGTTAPILQILQLLVARHTSFDFVAEDLEAEFSTCLLEELARFTNTNRPRLLAGKVDASWFTMQLSLRLKLIRQFYGVHPSVKISLSTVETLWSMLSSSSSPESLEALLSFFAEGVEYHHYTLDCIYKDEDVDEIFTKFICSTEIDWAKCGETAFSCFNTFSVRANSLSGDVQTLGLKTLWRITLCIPSAEATKDAMDLLLKTYEIMSLRGGGQSSLFEIAFSHLQENIDEAGSGSKSLNDLQKVRVSRLVDLLGFAISRSESKGVLFHAICGSMSRIQITVNYKRTRQHQHHQHLHDKPTETVTTILELHPLMTLSQLKERLARYLSFSVDPSSIVLENAAKTLSRAPPTARLVDVGLTDGSEISASKSSYYDNTSSSVIGESNDDGFISSSSPSSSSFSSLNVGVAISQNEAQFRCLLNLCEVVKDADILKKMWNLLMIIPTQDDLASLIRCSFTDYLSSDASHKRIDWNDLLGSSIASKTYMLQVTDHVMQPSPEVFSDDRSILFAQHAKKAFLQSGGFSVLVSILKTIEVGGDEIKKQALSTALHMLHYILFDEEEEGEEDSSEGRRSLLFSELEASSSSIVEKLLDVASDAAESQNTGLVQEAFEVLRHLLKSADVTSLLIENPQTKELLSFCLKSGSQKVRAISSEFAMYIGASQPAVFQWLVSEIENIDEEDMNCFDTFQAICTLLNFNPQGVDFIELASLLSSKILWFRRRQPTESSEVLLGFLNILEILIGNHPDIVASTELGQNLIHTILSEFLFALPSVEEDRRALCTTNATREKAFNVLAVFVSRIPSHLGQLLQELDRLKEKGLLHNGSQGQLPFGLVVSGDKKPSISYTGLKNQGCTCYMNSLLQQLFMCTDFRETILKTQIREEFRWTISHIKDEDLVGKIVEVEINSEKIEKFIRLEIQGFNPSTGKHTIAWFNERKEVVKQEMNFRTSGSIKRARVVKNISGSDEEDQELSPQDAAALYIFEQLQRTFCYMKFSNRRFFDPVLFVESCKSMTELQFNVYLQNDSAEFYDAVIDRVEKGTKGLPLSACNLWDNLLQKVFGTTTVVKKIPKQCETYETNKEECGHWKGSMRDTHYKIILEVKETMEEAFANYFADEHMDGDNAIECEECKQKKDTIRRTFMGDMPAILSVHLKRFNLDFNTFETVKLNSRMAFPTRINMLKYCSRGVEWEERKRAAAAKAAESGAENNEPSSPGRRSAEKEVSTPLQYESPEEPDGYVPPNPDDYEYELQGVLVHAGVAQGGHYYSFIRDGENQEVWHRFDDEDVTPFNPDYIPHQCFGGPPSFGSTTANSNSYSSHEEDRTSNALILFYRKVKPNNPAASEEGTVSDGATALPPSPPEQAAAVSPSSTHRYLDGYEAFTEEVRTSNLQHTLIRYLSDSATHKFVLSLLENIENSPDATEKDILSAFTFTCSFFVDIVLHFRERSKRDVKMWYLLLGKSFAKYIQVAVWFLTENLASWFLQFTRHCHDSDARKSYCNLIVAALTALDHAVINQRCTVELLDRISSDVLKLVIEAIDNTAFDPKCFDEVAMLIRDLAKVERSRQLMIHSSFIQRLAFFLDPQSYEASAMRESLIEKQPDRRKWGHRDDYMHFAESVLEAIAALLGKTVRRKANLLAESIKPTTYSSYSSSSAWDMGTELSDDAKDAFTTIFLESCSDGGITMSAEDVEAYSQRIGMNQALTEMLRKFITAGQLDLESFIQFQTDRHEPKYLWGDLMAFGFREDLSREGFDIFGLPSGIPYSPELNWTINSAELQAISNFGIYEYGLSISEQSVHAIAESVCRDDKTLSIEFLSFILERLRKFIETEGSYSNVPGSHNYYPGFLVAICSIDDEYKRDRVQTALTSPSGGLVTSIMRFLTYNSHGRPAPHAYIYNSMKNKYLNIFGQFLRHTKLSSAVRDISASMTVVGAVKRLVKVPDTQFSEEEDECIRGAVVMLSDAGVPEVNGEYKWKGFLRDAGWYAKECMYEGEPFLFSVYKCKVSSGSHKYEDSQWFISATALGRDPGTKDDIDFYYGINQPNALLEGRILPPLTFLREPHHSVSWDPSPTVEIRYSSRLNAIELLSSMGAAISTNKLDSDSDEEAYSTTTSSPDRDRVGPDDSFDEGAFH